MFLLRKLKTIERLITQIIFAVAIALLALVSLIAFYQIITRFVFHSPSVWSEVLARTLNIWMIYLGMVVACRYGSMMAVDTLAVYLRGRIKAALIILVALSSVTILLIVAWYGYDLTVRVRFQKIAGLRYPWNGGRVSISWMYAALPVGALLAACATVIHMLEKVHALWSGSESGQELPVSQQEIQL